MEGFFGISLRGVSAVAPDREIPVHALRAASGQWYPIKKCRGFSLRRIFYGCGSCNEKNIIDCRLRFFGKQLEVFYS